MSEPERSEPEVVEVITEDGETNDEVTEVMEEQIEPETEPEVETDSAVMAEPEPESEQVIAPPEMFADELQKTLENSPEWQEMEKSLKETLEQFNVSQTKEVVDVPLIKGTIRSTKKTTPIRSKVTKNHELLYLVESKGRLFVPGLFPSN